MSCNCINDLKISGKCSIDLVGNKLTIESNICACGQFEEEIEIKYCPIYGKEIESDATEILKVAKQKK